jgi:hypothetical protein
METLQLLLCNKAKKLFSYLCGKHDESIW